mmetsp:Transcript_86975/g.182028  ORF Transcript_86975/g.182028 Transcript_86975/m.182028 type:complete len:283 (-) Transcript_86975:100-948(-)|eukprot:CAMPEP_0206445610 /NCGR_PEP_ID=MMETSP0324_2-20121206/15624_1 /ASSEMBLY_ACC=CAM_ASM_000836 /TAXON_ID=2866 /ORGANISM="Crypthecodinium cohnii, Strain Seligo" /LENGTH=282 /DNA_ID=CAMNT_0053913885 /DNA_START=81 /DNA_END=929 /DNA_ORIENTATION=+
MAIRTTQALRFRVTRALRAGGADDAKPRWTLPEADYHKFTYQPSIPDKHFNIGHWNYAPITMWLRARRPTMEKVLGDVWTTLTCTWKATTTPVMATVDANLPGFGYKVLGVVGALLGYNLFVMYVTNRTEAFMFLEKLRLYALGDELVHHGFFKSDAEEVEGRIENVANTTGRLNSLWDTALDEATKAKSFEKLCEYIEVEESAIPALPKPITWRFSMMPYGRDDPDSQTFGFPDVDSPRGSVTPLLDAGSTGEYIDRVDNKPNPIRKGRHMYAAAYLPPTK